MITEKVFKCLVCKQDFTGGWEHALKRGKDVPFLIPIDEEHSDALNKINGLSSFNCPLCNSAVRTIGNG